MNGFIKKSVGTLTLGEKLKKLRSERRISLNEVSRATKIQVKYLEYLENGAYEKLPADVYVKGFLRNYSEFLGVDEKMLIKHYDQERGIQKNLEKNRNLSVNLPRWNLGGADWRKKNSPPGQKKISVSAFVITPRIITISLIILLVFGGFFYLYREIGAFASTPRLAILSPDQNYSTSGNSVTVEGVTDADARIFINDQPVLVNEDGKFRENLTVQSGANTIIVRAVNRFNKETAETLNIQSTYQPPAENSPEQSDQPAQSGAAQKLEVEVRVDPGPVWVSVEADGNLLFSGTMLTGAAQTFQADNKISINSGKGNATFVKFNGHDMGALSDNSGAVRGVTFTADTKY